MNEIQKPLSMLVEDFKANIVGVCNNSGLPLNIVAMILGELNLNIQKQDLDNTNREREQYYKLINEQQEQQQQEEK